MTNYIFDQLRFARNNTVGIVKGVDEETALHIPEGFNNNIKWNLGHIYLVQEMFAFRFIGEKMEIPESFPGLFGPGSKPSEWDNQVPSLDELIQMLKNQTNRIEQVLQDRLKEAVKQPFTTSSGLTLSTVEELLTWSLYHEAIHFDTIKTFKRLLRK